jgi:hypothetical protein
MAKKTKINKTAAALTDTAANLGLVLMTAATTLGMVDVPQHPDKRVVLPTRPSFAFAGQNAESELQSSTLRREREETGPHYISYNVAQRTPGRTGKV